MIWKNFTFKGNAISTTTADFQIGITSAVWKTLDVSDQQENVQGTHGIKLSPTFVRGRRITFEWLILADDHIGSSKGIDYLENMFALQGIPNQVELLPMTVTDEQDMVWTINAKIKEPVSIELPDDDHIIGTTRRWRVVLQAEDPRFWSNEELEVIGAEWHFWGFKMGVKLWAKFNETFNEVVVYSPISVETPLKITLTIKNDLDAPLKIQNLTQWYWFALDLNAVTDDVVVIDAITKKVTLNGDNILHLRVPWSTRPHAKETTVYTIQDIDGGLVESDFDILVQYKYALL